MLWVLGIVESWNNPMETKGITIMAAAKTIHVPTFLPVEQLPPPNRRPPGGGTIRRGTAGMSPRRGHAAILLDQGRDLCRSIPSHPTNVPAIFGPRDPSRLVLGVEWVYPYRRVFEITTVVSDLRSLRIL